MEAFERALHSYEAPLSGVLAQLQMIETGKIMFGGERETEEQRRYLELDAWMYGMLIDACEKRVGIAN